VTTPGAPDPDDATSQTPVRPTGKDSPGVEIGLSDEAGGTFESEEDPDRPDGASR
jgi:hypothetical protein